MTFGKAKLLVNASVTIKALYVEQKSEFLSWQGLKASLTPYLLNCILWHFLPTTVSALLNYLQSANKSCSITRIYLSHTFPCALNEFSLLINSSIKLYKRNNCSVKLSLIPPGGEKSLFLRPMGIFLITHMTCVYILSFLRLWTSWRQKPCFSFFQIPLWPGILCMFNKQFFSKQSFITFSKY